MGRFSLPVPPPIEIVDLTPDVAARTARFYQILIEGGIPAELAATLTLKMFDGMSRPLTFPSIEPDDVRKAFSR